MGDSFSEVSYNSFGSRLMKSVGGAVIGLLLAVCSFPVLWWNEGRTNWGDVAKKAAVVSPAATGTDGEGKLVSVTGPLTATERVGDPQFLKAGPYLELDRKVEMYAWKETKKSKEEKQVGGGSKTITTYDYARTWSEHPQASDEFRHPDGHENPAMTLQSQSFKAHSARLGSFEFDPESAELPGAQAFTPAPGDYLVGGALRGAQAARTNEVAPQQMGEYLFQGKGTLESPRVGDVRISFEAVKPLAEATLFGQRAGSKIEAATVDKDTFYRVLAGSRAQAIDTLQTEHTVTTWLLRLVGFLMMWLGAAAVFGPINTFLDIVPIAGSAGRFMVTVALFPITLGISVLVIITSIIVHSLVAMIIVGLGAAAAVAFFVKKRRAPASPAPGMVG